MAIYHYAGYKLTALLLGVLGVMVIALDPTVKVAIVMSIPATIVGVGGLVFQYLTRRDAKYIRNKVDGINDGLRDKAAVAEEKAADSSQQLAHAQGRREGVESKEGGK